VGPSIEVDDGAYADAYANTNKYKAFLGNCEAAFNDKNNWKCLKHWNIVEVRLKTERDEKTSTYVHKANRIL